MRRYVLPAAARRAGTGLSGVVTSQQVATATAVATAMVRASQVAQAVQSIEAARSPQGHKALALSLAYKAATLGAAAGDWRPTRPTKTYDQLYTNETYARAVWPSAKAMADEVYLTGASLGLPLVAYGLDAWLEQWGGSPDPSAPCIFAHIHWWFAKHGQGDWMADTFVKDGALAPTQLAGDPRAPTMMRIPLRSAEDARVRGDQSQIRVRDLDWFLPGWPALAETLRQKGEHPSREMVIDDFTSTGGLEKAFGTIAGGYYLASWTGRGIYFGMDPPTGEKLKGIAEQIAIGNTTSLIPSIVSLDLVGIIIGIVAGLMKRIAVVVEDVNKLNAAYSHAVQLHQQWNAIKADVDKTVADVADAARVANEAGAAVGAQNNVQAQTYAIAAQQSAERAARAFSAGDKATAVKETAAAREYAGKAYDAAGQAVQAAMARDKNTKYLIYGGAGLGALLLLFVFTRR